MFAFGAVRQPYRDQIAAAASAEVDGRADIYSLGCALYHCLAGRPPFAGSTATEKLATHLTQTPEPLGQLRPDLPAGLVRVVEAMMTRDPQGWPATPAAVIELLRPFLLSGMGASLLVGKDLLPSSVSIPETRNTLIEDSTLVSHGNPGPGRAVKTWAYGLAVAGAAVVAGVLAWGFLPGREAADDSAGGSEVVRKTADEQKPPVKKPPVDNPDKDVNKAQGPASRRTCERLSTGTARRPTMATHPLW